MQINFKEPIFYHDGDNSTFLDASKLSINGIQLAKTSNFPDKKKGKIEFSFPKLDYVVKADVSFTADSKGLYIKFEKMSKQSEDIISSYISSKGKIKDLHTIGIC